MATPAAAICDTVSPAAPSGPAGAGTPQRERGTPHRPDMSPRALEEARKESLLLSARRVGAGGALRRSATASPAAPPEPARTSPPAPSPPPSTSPTLPRRSAGLHAVALIGGEWWGGGPLVPPAGPCAARPALLQTIVGGGSPAGCHRAASLRALLPGLCLPQGARLRPALAPRASLARVAGCHAFQLRGQPGEPPLHGACLQYWEPVSLGGRKAAGAEALFCLCAVSEAAFFGAHFLSLHSALSFDLSERRSPAGPRSRRRGLEEGLFPATMRALAAYLQELGSRAEGDGAVSALRLARERGGGRPGLQALGVGKHVLREFSSLRIGGRSSRDGVGRESEGSGGTSGLTLRLEPSGVAIDGGHGGAGSSACSPFRDPPPSLLPPLEVSPARGRLAAPFHDLTWGSGGLNWAVAAAAEALPLTVLLCALSAALTERQVAVVGDSLCSVTSVVLGLAELLKPFSYQGTLMPLVPPKLLPLLDAPTPFLLGVLRESLPHGKVVASTSTGVLILDLARGGTAALAAAGAPGAVPVPPIPGEAQLRRELAPVRARLLDACGSAGDCTALRFPGHLPVEAACAALELSVLVEDHLRTFAERVARHSLRDAASGLCILLQEALFRSFEAEDLLFLDDFLSAQTCTEHFGVTRL